VTQDSALADHCTRAFTNLLTYSLNAQRSILTNNLFIERLFHCIHLELANQSLRQGHNIFDVTKQCLHVLGRQCCGLRHGIRKERLKTQLQTGAVVRLGRVEFRDDFLTSFTMFRRQLLLADWRRLNWRCVTCFRTMKMNFCTCFSKIRCFFKFRWLLDFTLVVSCVETATHYLLLQ